MRRWPDSLGPGCSLDQVWHGIGQLDFICFPGSPVFCLIAFVPGESEELRNAWLSSTSPTQIAIRLAMYILAPLLAVALAWAYIVGTNHLALKAWRKSAGEHWTERARILFPIRRSAGLNVWMVSVNCTLDFGSHFCKKPGSWSPRRSTLSKC